MSPWLQALLVGVVGVAFALVMMKRLRKRHWPKAPKVVLPMAEADDKDENTPQTEGETDSDQPGPDGPPKE